MNDPEAILMQTEQIDKPGSFFPTEKSQHKPPIQEDRSMYGYFMHTCCRYSTPFVTESEEAASGTTSHYESWAQEYNQVSGMWE